MDVRREWRRSTNDERNFVWVYLKSSFTKNWKKQCFLIFGIAAFMVLVSVQVISQDSETGELYRQIANQRWGYDVKISGLSEEQQQALLVQPEVRSSYVMRYVEITEGMTNAVSLVSADFPDRFFTEYIYGNAPRQGEIALPESARIDGKRPEIGQEIVFEIQAGSEKKDVTALVSGVFEEHSIYNTACVAMNGQDFAALLKKEVLRRRDWHMSFWIVEG